MGSECQRAVCKASYTGGSGSDRVLQYLPVSLFRTQWNSSKRYNRRMTTVRRADPEARKLAFIIVGVGAMVGVALILAAEKVRPSFEQWLVSNSGWLAQNPAAAAAVAGIAILPMAGVAIYLWRYAGKVVATERFPLAGQKVVRDTPVRFGPRAIRHGRILQSLAALVLAVSFAMPCWIYAIIRSLDS